MTLRDGIAQSPHWQIVPLPASWYPTYWDKWRVMLLPPKGWKG